ncbi:MAG: Hsp33 family molecular chaperone HslO [Spirochaetes bacterium]|nr:Hsp33 family molecular chaperone HslO [Spirochaetota bacterium]
MSADFISRILCNELNVRAYAVSNLAVAKELSTIHTTTPPATLALARTITAAALLSATLKPDSDQNVRVKFTGNGPIKEIHVQADARGSMRGYVANPLIEIGDTDDKMSFPNLIGDGFLSIIKDIGLKEPYQTVLPLKKNDIATEIAYYLTYSEQIPSAIIIGAKLNENMELTASGGVLVQIFPETDLTVIEAIEHRIMNKNFSVGDILERGESIHSYLTEIFDGKPFTVLHTMPLKHNCRCSKELIRTIMKGFSLEELYDMREKDQKAEIECSFCKKKYLFDAEELSEIISLKMKGESH